MKRRNKMRGMALAGVMIMSICLTGCSGLEEIFMQELETAVVGELETALGDETEAALFDELVDAMAEEAQVPEEVTEEVTEETDSAAAEQPAAKEMELPYYEMDGIMSPKLEAVKVSSEASGDYPGEHAVDGDTATYWVTEEGDSQTAWIEITFVQPFTISEIWVEQGDYDDFYGHGRMESMDMVFEDGSTQTIDCKFEDMDIFSQEIIPKTTKTVVLNINSIYAGDSYDDLVIRDLGFLYNPNNSFGGLEEADEPVMQKILEDMGQGNKQSGHETAGADDNTGADNNTGTYDTDQSGGYVPEFWSWQTSGYSDQDFVDPVFTPGKWVSEDGNTVLYLDFSDSAEFFHYGLYHNGTQIEDYTDVIRQYIEEKGIYQAIGAYDRVNFIFFEVIEEGVMGIVYEKETLYVTLKREKY